MTTLNSVQHQMNKEQSEEIRGQSKSATDNQSLKKISILISKEMHRAIKLHAIRNDTSIKDYITELILSRFEEEN
jgi:predicted HicB family RNase H-like nuclease